MHLCPDEIVPFLMLLPGLRILVARVHAWWHRRRASKCHAPGSAPRVEHEHEHEHDLVGEVASPSSGPSNAVLVEQDEEEVVEVAGNGRVYRRGEAPPKSGLARQITILRDPRGEY